MRYFTVVLVCMTMLFTSITIGQSTDSSLFGAKTTLFSLASASYEYYTGKNISIKYYKKHLTKLDATSQYIKYCKERIQYLKEVKHQLSKS